MDALELNHIYNEDCLNGMKNLPDQSIDMVLCDLPFGTTSNRWDSVIPFEPLWEQYKRVTKPRAAIVLTAQVPFNITLGASNLKWLRYEWIWVKSMATGFLNAKKYPLKAHENILVFCSGVHRYNPQMSVGKPYTTTRGHASTNYRQMGCTTTINLGDRYPTTTLSFDHDRPNIHPTQKPVALFEYLIRTYTDPGQLVLDNCMGSGTTAIACVNAGRNYIGFESDAEYHTAALDRIAKHTHKFEQSASLDMLFEAS